MTEMGDGTTITDEQWAQQLLGRFADVAFVLDLDGTVAWRRELRPGATGSPDHLVESAQMLERIHPDEMGIALAAFDDLVAGRADRVEVDVRLQAAHDPDEWMLSRVTATRLPDGRVAGLSRILENHLEVGLTNPSDPGFSIADVTPFGIALVGEGDLVVYTNEAFRTATGLGPGPLPDDSAIGRILAEGAARARTNRTDRSSTSVDDRALVISAHRLGAESRPEVLITVQDTTELSTLRAARQSAEQLFSTAFEHAPAGMALVGLDHGFLRVNPAFAEITGYTTDELLELGFEAITHPDDLGPDLDLVRQIVNGKLRSYRLEKRYLHKDGHAVWVELRVAGAYDDAGALTNFISQITDITSRKLIEEQQRANEAVLLHRATHDHLTDVANRALLDEHLRLLIARVRRGTDTGGLLYCDLDGFKAINDAHGHLVGDRVLIETADRLRSLVRETDLVARVGGDEFVIALSGAAHPEGITTVADRVHAVVCQTIEDPEIGPVGVGASLGVVTLDASDDPTTALHRADSLAYEAKRSGGGISRQA